VTVGGVDTYYDYDERQWKFRRLGGGPVRKPVVCPEARPSAADEEPAAPHDALATRTRRPRADGKA
jgi:hypothetical protein